MISIKTLLSKHTGVTVIDRKIELPALGLNSAFIITLLLNCCSEDKRDLPWPVQTCIRAPYFRQYSDIDTVLAAQVRFENAKTRHFVAAVSFIAQQRPLLRTGVTLIRMRCAGCGVEAEMASTPRQHLRRSAFLIRIHIIGWGFCFWSLSDGFLAKSVAGRHARAERPCLCSVSSSGR